jgi:hypothetical protein
MHHPRPPLYVVDRYEAELEDRETRRVLRRVGLALLAALLVGAMIGVAT